MSTPSEPTPPPSAGDAERRPPPRYDDEISLRELYLILKRGMPLIVIVSVVAAALAVAVMMLRPDAFEAEATVVSAPTGVQLRGEGVITFEPRSSVPFATYENLALSRSTFERTLERLGDDAGALGSFRDLQRASDLEQLTGPSNANDPTPLSVIHRVTWGDPSTAARFADAWAETTVEQVRSALLADLEPARESALATLEVRTAELEEAEEAWGELQLRNLHGLEQELEGFLGRIVDADQRLTDLARQIAGVQAQREVLLAQVRAGAGDSLPSGPATDDPETTIDLLYGFEQLDSATAAQLRLWATEGLTEAPAGEATASVVSLLATTRLQGTTASLASLTHEHDQVAASRDELREQADALRTEVASLRREELRIDRVLTDARNAYDSVKNIEPALRLVADMAPRNTRILNAAQEPVTPSGVSIRLVAVIAFIVAGMAATLFVFLREAVRGPGDGAARA